MNSLAYLGYLARNVPPARLLELVGIRLWRQTLRQRGRFLEPPAEAELLRSFGVESAASLPGRLAEPLREPLALVSPQVNGASARILRERFPAEAFAAIARADASLARRIVVFGVERALPSADRRIPHATAAWRAIDWEADPRVDKMEREGRASLRSADRAPERHVRLRGRSGAGGPLSTEDLGAEQPVGLRRLRERPDPKMQWVVGRLEEVVHLACGALLVSPEDPARAWAFADAALDRMVDFSQAPRGIQWTCTMEVALRAANMAIALRLLAGAPALEARPLALLEILRFLALQLEWIQLHLEDGGAFPNNHLVANWTGLLAVAALLPRLPGAQAAARRASRGLASELFAQTLPDGFTFEGSVGYHRLAVELFLLGDLCASTTGLPLPEPARRRLHQLFEASLALVDGRGLSPRIGDDDSGRALPFRPRESVEQGWLPPIGAVLFGDPALDAGSPSPELIWLLGPGALDRLGSWQRARPAADSALPYGGIYLLRSRRISAAIACGPNGTGGLGTHGHNDKLSVEVCVDGALVVGDPGSGSYTGDPLLRDRLRGTAAHSTVRVDGQEQQPIPEGRLFALPEQAWARCLSFESLRDRARFHGEHQGYLRLGVLHRREVRLDRIAERLEILDSLSGEGEHAVQIRFLIPGHEARVRRSRGGELPGWVVEIGPAAAPIALLLGSSPDGAAESEGRPRLEPACHARGYAQLSRAVCAVFTVKGALPIVFRTALIPARGK